MRLTLLLVTLAAVAVLPSASAATVVVPGTTAAWITPVVTASPGDTVVFTSLEGCHPSFVDGLVPTGNPPIYGCTTTYANVPAGTYQFRCTLHPLWMVGVLVVD